MKALEKQTVDAIVLDAELTKTGDRLKVKLQVMGGGVEMVFPTKEEATDIGIKKNGRVAVDVAYVPHGQGESTREKDGKTFTSRFPTFRQQVFLSRDQGPSAKAA